MAAIVWSDVTTMFPAAPVPSVGAQAVILSLVNTRYPARVDLLDGEDGPAVKMARIAAAAHLATIDASGASGASGPVTSESADGLHRSYAWSGSVDTSLASTAYGRLYLELIGSSLAALPLGIGAC